MTTVLNKSDSWVVVQRNPLSGSGYGVRELKRLLFELRERGFRVRLFSVRSRLDAWMRAASGVREVRCIVAAGGDGTVADLVNRHPGIPLAILPMGTENLLAKYLGLRCCGRLLAGVIADGSVRRLDSATANGRRVLLMASCGPDADVVSDVHHRRAGHISRWSYVVPVLRALLWSGQRRFEVTAAELSAPAYGSHVIISNVPRYGFEIPFAPEAEPDDGLLDVRVYRGSGRWELLWHLLRLKLGLPIRESETREFRTTAVSVCVVSSGAVAGFQADGDPGGSLPLQVRIEPGSLYLLSRR